MHVTGKAIKQICLLVTGELLLWVSLILMDFSIITYLFYTSVRNIEI